MRARYTAFEFGDEPTLSWTGLFIAGRASGGLLESNGTVEFTARFRRADGSSGRLRETSRFVRVDGNWRYLGPA